MHTRKYSFVNKISTLVFIVLLVTLAASQLITGSTTIGNTKKIDIILKNKNKPNRDVHDDLLIEISPTCKYSPEDFKAMGESVDRALTFFEANVDKLVLDAAVGTRVVQVQLQLALKSHPNLPSLLQQYLNYLMDRAGALSEKIIQAVKDNPNISQAEKEHTIPWVTTPNLWDWPLEGHWESNSVLESYGFDTQNHNQNFSQILSETGETIDETESDTCIFQVFNCETQDISPKCRQLFLQKEQSLYSLTHQVIYTLFARKRQCTRNLDSDELRLYQQKLCGKVWREANAIAESGFPASYIDLFVEQVGICGMTGYPNFFRQDWLHQILSWQSESVSGCFVDQRVPMNSIAMLLKLYQENQEKFHEMINQRFNKPSRQKRSDAFLRQSNSENCSVHFTAVGITAIAVQMRNFVDTCLANY